VIEFLTLAIKYPGYLRIFGLDLKRAQPKSEILDDFGEVSGLG
jgi:hypothetical protein